MKTRIVKTIKINIIKYILQIYFLLKTKFKSCFIKVKLRDIYK